MYLKKKSNKILLHFICKMSTVHCVWIENFKSHITFLHKQNVHFGILSIHRFVRNIHRIFCFIVFCWFFDVVVVSHRMEFTGNETHAQSFSRDKLVFIFNWSFCLMRIGCIVEIRVESCQKVYISMHSTHKSLHIKSKWKTKEKKIGIKTLNSRKTFIIPMIFIQNIEIAFQLNPNHRHYHYHLYKCGFSLLNFFANMNYST